MKIKKHLPVQGINEYWTDNVEHHIISQIPRPTHALKL